MLQYKDINEARKLLNLPEQASMDEIRSNYRRLIRMWHPDRCGQDNAECHEMTQKIIKAYQTITLYCSQYMYSFAREDVEKHLSNEEWWYARFGDDPLWGNAGKQK
jgi:DnaJ-class molecular chaperone